MLKIKDNVDLQELKKFGFKHKKEQRNQYEHYAYLVKNRYDLYPHLHACVWCHDRRIALFDNEINILFDLIQAGLVEKVGDEK